MARKIGFYYFTVNDAEMDLHDCFVNTLNVIEQLSNLDRKRTIVGNKFGYLDTIASFNNNRRHQLVFKSATNNFRPPLLDKDTVNERDSPKSITEGETHKTHLVSKMVNGDLIVILESYRDGLTIRQVVNYLNSFSSDIENPYHFHAEMILKDDFLEELNGLERVVSAEIYVDKQLLGSETLNFSERINPVKHEVVLSVKALNRDNIVDFARDLYGKFTGGRQEIRRIRLKGKSEDNSVVILNTDRIERQEYVHPGIDGNTGEIITDELLEAMEGIMFNF
jgi:hypothetical protein